MHSVREIYGQNQFFLLQNVQLKLIIIYYVYIYRQKYCKITLEISLVEIWKWHSNDFNFILIWNDISTHAQKEGWREREREVIRIQTEILYNSPCSCLSKCRLTFAILRYKQDTCRWGPSNIVLQQLLHILYRICIANVLILVWNDFLHQSIILLKSILKSAIFSSS